MPGRGASDKHAQVTKLNFHMKSLGRRALQQENVRRRPSVLWMVRPLRPRLCEKRVDRAKACSSIREEREGSPEFSAQPLADRRIKASRAAYLQLKADGCQIVYLLKGADIASIACIAYTTRSCRTFPLRVEKYGSSGSFCDYLRRFLFRFWLDSSERSFLTCFAEAPPAAVLCTEALCAAAASADTAAAAGMSV